MITLPHVCAADITQQAGCNSVHCWPEDGMSFVVGLLWAAVALVMLAVLGIMLTVVLLKQTMLTPTKVQTPL